MEGEAGGGGASQTKTYLDERARLTRQRASPTVLYVRQCAASVPSSPGSADSNALPCGRGGCGGRTETPPALRTARQVIPELARSWAVGGGVWVLGWSHALADGIDGRAGGSGRERAQRCGWVVGRLDGERPDRRHRSLQPEHCRKAGSARHPASGRGPDYPRLRVAAGGCVSSVCQLTTAQRTGKVHRLRAAAAGNADEHRRRMGGGGQRTPLPTPPQIAIARPRTAGRIASRMYASRPTVHIACPACQRSPPLSLSGGYGLAAGTTTS